MGRRARWVVVGTAVVWMASPVLAWMSGRGLNWAMALLMVPLLMRWGPDHPAVEG